jgi:hypothetical protein
VSRAGKSFKGDPSPRFEHPLDNISRTTWQDAPQPRESEAGSTGVPAGNVPDEPAAPPPKPLSRGLELLAQAEQGPAALVEIQAAELDRLARDNARPMDRLDALLQIQQREQVLRQQLQNQVIRLTEQATSPPAGPDLATIRHEARETMSSDLKPVLTVVLHLLERLADKAPGAPTAAAAALGQTPPPEDFQDIPAFLKQPIEQSCWHPPANVSPTAPGGVDPNRRDQDTRRDLPPAATATPKVRPTARRVKRPVGKLPGLFDWMTRYA